MQFILVRAILAGSMLVSVSAAGIDRDWEAKVEKTRWVAYSPTESNPQKGTEASEDAVERDLKVLRTAGFTGLVTYSSNGVLGAKLPAIAQSMGFQAMIIGVWDPGSASELDAARNAMRNTIVIGACVGNEGLHFGRYDRGVLVTAIETLRRKSGKPVTTTEVLNDYSDPSIRELGDWVFPTVHPYFAKVFDPTQAMPWTTEQFELLRSQTDRYVWLKEVGLPTAGDGARTSEQWQKEYYCNLSASKVRFVYFEAFDQPWKQNLPIEPHWGLFTAQRQPKLAAKALAEPALCKSPPVLLAQARTTPQRVPAPRAANPEQTMPFYVYKDDGSPENHFSPKGYMGDVDDIEVDIASENRPHSGRNCIKVTYSARGSGKTHTCEYSPPCKWSGEYWLEPEGNWGKEAQPQWRSAGFNLSRAQKLTFWARAEKESRVVFKVGGIRDKYGDSLEYARSVTGKLGTEWQKCEIDLTNAPLQHIIGGFAWIAERQFNPAGTVFYIDEIKFESGPPENIGCGSDRNRRPEPGK